MRLTSAGELMLAGVRRLQRDFEATLAQVDALKGLRRGKVRIGVLQYLSERFIPMLVAEVRGSYPGISFTIHVGNSDDIAGRIAQGDLDIGLCWTPPAPAPLRRVRSVPVSVGVVLPADHPLGARRALHLRECGGLNLVMPTAEMELRRMLDQSQAGARTRIEPFLETNSIGTMRQLALDGAGAAVMTRISVLQDVRAGRLVHVPLADRGVKTMEFSLLVRAQHNLPLAAALLLERLEARFDEYAGPH